MKKILFALLMLAVLGVNAQESVEKNPKLEALKTEKNKTVLQKELKDLENGSMEDYSILLQYYNNNKAKINEIDTRIVNGYPSSEAARMIRMQKFAKLSEPAEIEALTNKYIKEYPKINLDTEKAMAALAYSEIPDTAKVMLYINKIQDPIYQVYGVKMAAEIIDGFDSPTALALTNSQLDKALALQQKSSLTGELKIDPKVVFNEFIDIYSKLLFKAKKYEEAYKYTTEAYNSIENKDAELIENYAFLSSLNGNYGVALPILSNAVKEGNSDPRFIEQVRLAFSSLYPDKDVDTYINDLKNGFIDKVRKHVSTLMIKEDAPNFSVTDAAGKRVSLADFKGKTIVLDFWATWCGPCVESFPAMQMAVDRFKDDPNVKFLFIHTFENAKDPLADATNFLAKRNYRLDLYMDLKDPSTRRSPAADAFKIDGIPAKFIIDGNGKIRFTAAGFSGKAEEVAEEVVQMVEMARTGA